jgi:hypothetical protein
VCCGDGSRCGGVTDEMVRDVRLSLLWAFADPRTAAKAQYEASAFATGIRESRAARAAMAAELECSTAWTATPRDRRNVAELLSCRRSS